MDPKRRGNYLRETAKDEWAMGNAKTDFHWRGARDFALAACLAGGWMVAGSPGKAQVPSASQGSRSDSRLLSAEEGRAIVDATRGQDQPAGGARGCSHLVHQAYLEAGFEYPCCGSFD